MSFKEIPQIVETPFLLEEKDYGPVKQNNVNFAPWHGTNTKVPGVYDLLPVDMPEDKKVDITDVELKPIVQEIEKEEEIRAIKERKPKVIESAIILFAALVIAKAFLIKKTKKMISK